MLNLSRTLFPHSLGKPILRMMLFVLLFVTYLPESAWGTNCTIKEQDQIHLYNRFGNYVGNLQGPQNLSFATTDYTCDCPPASDLCNCVNNTQFYNLPGGRRGYMRIKETDYYFNQHECNSLVDSPVFALSNVFHNRKRRFTCKNPDECEAKSKQ
jgi:hypothetical protein